MLQMESGRRCSVALLFLTLVLAAGSLAAVAQFHPPADKRYMLVALQANRGDHVRLAMTTGDVSITGFANGTNHWFAVTGSESLLPFGNSYRRDIPGQGLGNLLRVLVNNGTS
ncbi:hypothetical protein BAE44_0001248 [Dichanthelium oligosanthes]|uniref:rRNA N-glycosylase n=1 Tax=Dichanthelium oligosanthes TaxID=888268 RepID=A0A1E5WK43_9POAL|nr:hypothetical protein BAE44_0001248 [Dichanthelium oligosanthes]